MGNTEKEKTWELRKNLILCMEFAFLVRCPSGEVMWGADVRMLSSEGRSGLSLPTKGPQRVGGVQSHWPQEHESRERREEKREASALKRLRRDRKNGEEGEDSAV